MPYAATYKIMIHEVPGHPVHNFNFFSEISRAPHAAAREADAGGGGKGSVFQPVVFIALDSGGGGSSETGGAGRATEPWPAHPGEAAAGEAVARVNVNELALVDTNHGCPCMISSQILEWSNIRPWSI